mmetsp:Transcript_119909/g.344533  ORF Transcript_119909/g.344533 Transcript_119909/m.344533 type:complete len:794 (-) Transcript_119909:91-2472(-)
MGIERILAPSERDFILKSVDYIEECMLKYQHNNVGSFVLGLSGMNGRVRRTRLADILTCLASRRNIDWQRVHVFLVDERYGIQQEEDSNACLVNDALVRPLVKNGASFPEGHLVYPDTSLSPVEACAAAYQERLEALFDKQHGPHLITLGLGQDLHVASVFPEWYQAVPERWAEATRKALGVLCTTTTIFEVEQRICVNLRIIRKAENIMLFLGEGTEEAWARVKKAFDEERFGERKPKRARRTIEPAGVMMNADGVMMVHSKAPKVKTVEPPPASPLDYVLKYSNVSVVQLRIDKENHYSLVVLGAAGDLAKKKTFPSIFHLHLGRFLPPNTSILGVDDPTFHSEIKNVDDFWERRLQPYLRGQNATKEDLQEFRDRLSFVPVRMVDAESVQALHQRIVDLVQGKTKDNRIFYLALPSFLFATTVKAMKANCWSTTGFCRVIVEKPFGKNGKEAKALSDSLKDYITEAETYRMDHYLAKTLVLNLLTLRFANREFGSLFHGHHIANVRITFKEAIGVQGRAGYFDGYGIIRDIMQNHLMQVLTLVAMEAPASLEAEDVRDEKVKVLKQIRPIDPKDCVIGQYEGYQDDPDIQSLNQKNGFASRCPTFAAVVLYLDNERWSGVPFIMKAGKAMETSSTIVRLQFKKAPPNSLFGDQPQNELVIRIQPNETIYYKILAKLPGLTQRAKDVQQTVLDLDLKKRFELRRTPEAYEKLIHDVIQGESHNFVRRDELDEAWRIFDPLLHQLEVGEKRVPERYTFGSRGPVKADALIDRMGFRRYTVTGVPGFAEDDFD